MSVMCYVSLLSTQTIVEILICSHYIVQVIDDWSLYFKFVPLFIVWNVDEEHFTYIVSKTINVDFIGI